MVVRKGRVCQLDSKQALCRVQFNEKLITDYLPWLTSAGSLVRVWNPPQVGEQVVVIANELDFSDGIIIGSLFQQAYPAPASKDNQLSLVFADQSQITKTNQGDLMVKQQGNLLIEASGEMKLKAQRIDLN